MHPWWPRTARLVPERKGEMGVTELTLEQATGMRLGPCCSHSQYAVTTSKREPDGEGRAVTMALSKGQNIVWVPGDCHT